nr:hypothetical protein [Tanacetum cinerariifolium]
GRDASTPLRCAQHDDFVANNLILHAVALGIHARFAALAGFYLLVAKLIAEVQLHEAAFYFVDILGVDAGGEHVEAAALSVEHV